jgi:DNA-binding SARP family transcriptional activator
MQAAMTVPFGQVGHQSGPCDASCPVLICLLGNFLLLKAGRVVVLRGGSKAESLLCQLGLHPARSIPRETLLDALWPSRDSTLAGQSLNSLIYSLHRLVGDAISGTPLVLHADGHYRLNTEGGIRVDVACFDTYADIGERHARAGNLSAAAETYAQAVHLYRGDLYGSMDVESAVERERLRARYLSLLAHLADYHYGQQDFRTCLDYTALLLAKDACREDAHRLAMRCYVRQGERAQALRQYRLCQDILRAEFDVAPEPATTALFNQVRLDPGSI